jgi:hypothetical protein
MPYTPHLRLGFCGSFTKNLEILAGGRFAFSQGQGRIAAAAFDLVSRRASEVEQLHD